MKQAVLSLSGGMDSTCLLLHLLSEGYAVKAYSFRYGQKHAIELDRVQGTVKFLQSKNLSLSHQIIDVTDCFNESASSLTKVSGVEIPEGSYKDENMKSTVVENRNVIFASIVYGKALAWSNKSGGKEVNIFLGVHAGDHTIYPDCTPESQAALEHAFKVSNWNSDKVSYEAPFMFLDKSEVLAAGVKAMKSLGFNEEEVEFVLAHTHTCYNPSETGKACGRCGSCNERILAFEANGMKDPVEYQDSWEEVLNFAKNQQ